MFGWNVCTEKLKQRLSALRWQGSKELQQAPILKLQALWQGVQAGGLKQEQDMSIHAPLVITCGLRKLAAQSIWKAHNELVCEFFTGIFETTHGYH